MDIINFKVDEVKKKEIEEVVKIKGFKSISEFIRQAIDDKIKLQKKIEEFKAKNPPFDRNKISIPDFIPDGKFLGISRNSIVAIGNTAQEVAEILAERFPDSASGIIHKGHESEKIDFVFSIFSIDEAESYHQVEYKSHFFPILPISIYFKDDKKDLYGLLDTGATITVINKNLIEKYELKPIKKKKVFTANGIIEVPIYRGKFCYKDALMELEFMTTEIVSETAFHALLGKDFIDMFNILFLGKEKLFCIQSL